MSRLPVSFWGDAVEYAAYILKRSPTSANAKRASPLEVLAEHAPELRDIVVFGSVCCLPRPAKKVAGEAKENKITVTHHVKDIETLSNAQNSQLQSALDYKDQAATTATASPTPAAEIPALTIRSGKKKSKSWLRAAHRMRSASRRPGFSRSQHMATV
ncbi:unnamed protein product [Peronospora destructor]|uniref:Polyprotein n=1 Tax=Peronospora destructor TaxID=86335 RepID=A0AAV0TVH9_9STRA|nr:unnamed protein product [Peronospora destructor]